VPARGGGGGERADYSEAPVSFPRRLGDGGSLPEYVEWVVGGVGGAVTWSARRGWAGGEGDSMRMTRVGVTGREGGGGVK
jgi:hypothetical protein